MTVVEDRVTIVPARARYEDDTLIFDGEQSLSDALKDGCFLLRHPATLDLRPGRCLARNFYKSPNGSDKDAYRGFRDQSGIYFDREHFQTEHLLMDRTQRLATMPTDVTEMCDAMAALGRQILVNVLEALKVPRVNWDAATAECLSGKAVEWMAVSHYRSDRRVLGCPAHKDTGYITILYFDQDGLQARRDGAWCNIDPVPGYFLVNFGGALERLTRRLIRPVEAVLHRVEECSPCETADERTSFAAFINPAASAMLCEVDEAGSIYEVERVEDFLREFNAKTWKDDHDAFGISDSASQPEIA